jgi:hypothetical protein
MKERLNVTIDGIVLQDFRQIHKGSLSAFIEDKMSEYVEQMRLKWWFICPECKKDVHIRIILNKNGFCPICEKQIAKKID